MDNKLESIADTDIKQGPVYRIEGETGWDRVKVVIKEYFHGENPVETNFIIEASGLSGILGFLFGGMFGTKNYHKDFQRKYNEAVYEHQHLAKRKYFDNMTLTIAKHGVKLGWRMGLFTLMFTSLSTFATVYRNDIYIRDIAAAGSLTYAMWKINQGLKAFTSAGIIGAFFGMTLGSTIKFAFWCAGASFAEYRFYKHSHNLDYLAKQNQMFALKMKKTKREDWSLLLEHDEQIKQQEKQQNQNQSQNKKTES